MGLFGFGFWDPTLILLVPGIIFALVAQNMVTSRYRRYSVVPVASGITGADAARHILERNGIHDIQIVQIDGTLKDNYNPKKRTINLSRDVYGKATVAAVGIAAHEAGHAVQHEKKYVFIFLRTALAPVASVGTYLSFAVVFIGLLMANETFAMAGVFVYTFVVLFMLITLPVELNASNRAIAIIGQTAILNDEEKLGARRILNAAALTYVAALVNSLLTLLRLLLIAGGARRR